MSGIQKQWLSKEEFEKRQGGSWTPSPHTHVKTDITDTPWVWGDVSKTGSNLTDLATRQHAGLTNVTSDQHHPQSHTLASHSTKPHSALTDVTESQHHNKLHSMTGVQHSAAGLTIGHVIRASGAAAFAWAQLQHGDLGGVTSDLHHAQLHAASHHVAGGDLLAFASITGFSTYLDQAVKQASDVLFNTTRFNKGSVAYYKNVAHYNYTISSVTGTMKITMPKTWSSTMLKIIIQGYDYGAAGQWSVEVSGYNYSSTPTWVNYHAEIHGNAPFSSVRLAHDGTKNVILLGTTSTEWSYPKAVITEFLAGHQNMTGWETGWSISIITDETGIGSIVTPTVETWVKNRLNIGSYYLNSLIANNKVPDSYKWHGYTPTGLTIGHVLKATGASAFAFQANNLGGLSDLNLGTLEEGETITYDQGSGKWIDAWGVEYDNPRLVWKMYTDFFSAGTTSNDPWVGAALIGGTMVARPGESNHPGIVRLNSTSTAESGYRWMTSTDCVLLGGAESSEFVFKTGINLTNVRIRLGFQDSLNDTAPTDGMYIDITGTTLKGITRNNGAETVTGTTYAISTSTWYRIKMALSTDEATATFWLYNAAGTLLWTNTTTTNIPTGAGRTLGHGVVAWIGVAAGQILIELDMMIASQAGTITR